MSTVILLFSLLCLSIEQPLSISDISVDTCQLVNDWRAENSIYPVIVTWTMTMLAEVHARNLDAYITNALPGCNQHSWFDDTLNIEGGRYHWQSCCYSDPRFDSTCMSFKGRELFNYSGYTFENYAAGSAITPNLAVSVWKNSIGHNMLLLYVGLLVPTKKRTVCFLVFDKRSNGFNRSDLMYSCGAAKLGRYLLLWMGNAPEKAPTPSPPTPKPTTTTTMIPITPSPTVTVMPPTTTTESGITTIETITTETSTLICCANEPP